MTLAQQIILEVLSAILFTMAIPNQFLKFGSPILGLIALIPHFICLNNSKSLKRIFILCFIQSITTHILSSFWLVYFKDFAVFTLGASALGTGFIHVFFGLFFYLPSFFKKTTLYSNSYFQDFLETKGFKVFWFAAVYTVWEFVKSRGFLAYPWGTLPMTAYHFKILSQITDITGVRGLTFLFSFFAAVMGTVLMDAIHYPVCTVLPRNKKILSCLLILFMLPVIYGVYQVSIIRRPVKHMNTIMIQQNYDPWKQKDDALSIYDSQRLTLEGIEQFKQHGKKTDLVVWSEGVLHYPFPIGAETHYKFFPELNPLIPFIRMTDAPTIIGTPWCHNMENHEFSNAAVLFNRNGTIRDYYAKIHLVPFAEHIPYTQYKIVQILLQRLIGFSYGWVPGWEYKVFNVELSDFPGQKCGISMPICYEDAFGDIFSGLKYLGTDVFVNLTDDSWSLTTSAEYQHFVISWFRAIEFRTTMLRSTNSGYSVVIDPAGSILADLPLFEQCELSYSVPIYKNIFTCYMMYGEWLSHLLLICILFILWKAVLYVNKDKFNL